MSKALYAATNLRSFVTEAKYLARDVEVDHICYRQLDPEYFAWLDAKLAQVHRQAALNTIETEAYLHAISLFDRIRHWAFSHFKHSDLKKQKQWMTSKRVRYYAVPKALPFLWPVASTPRTHFNRHVTTQILQKVEGIKAKAISLGWSDQELFSTQSNIGFPLGSYGLVCFLREKDRIGAVSSEGIEILGSAPRNAKWIFKHWVRGSAA